MPVYRVALLATQGQKPTTERVEALTPLDAAGHYLARMQGPARSIPPQRVASINGMHYVAARLVADPADEIVLTVKETAPWKR